jgi:hypothetical protein
MPGAPQSCGATAALALVCGVFALAILCFPVYVSPEGIRCYNFFGLYRTLPWHAVTRIGHDSVFGMGYLVVASSARRSEIYIPLYLSDMAAFTDVVREHARLGHPLVEALEACRA